MSGKELKMTFQAFLTTCTTLWGDSHTLHAYFADGRMCGIFREISERDFQSAVAALEAARQSSNPSKEVAEAIGYLQVALVERLEAANKRRYLGLAPASPYVRDRAYEIVVEASLLMALCFRYLKEPAQAREHLLNARRYFDDYAKAELDVVEASRWTAAGAGLAATMSDSYDVSSVYEDQENLMTTDQMEAMIEEEKRSLDKLIEMDARMGPTWIALTNAAEATAAAPGYVH